MKIAFTYDRINKFGGAERVLMALHEIWPEAPIFTAVYNPKTAPWAKDIKIIPSFLNSIPYFRSHHEILPTLTPRAFQSFDFSKYDLVVSITSAEAKYIKTSSKTKHICYCLTPTRYLWSHKEFYENQGINGKILKLIAPLLRIKDFEQAQKIDQFVGISKTVKKRIQKYYRKDADVIYPPVVMPNAKCRKKNGNKKNSIIRPFDHSKFYLAVSRLVPYKRLDIAIEACKKLDRDLVIIGSGSQLDELRSMAVENIKFVQDLTDDELSQYYMLCRAVIFPGDEDFGIVPVEAQAHGKPVIAFNQGGASETVVYKKTGLLFDNQSVSSLTEAIVTFEKMTFNADDCIKNSKKFSKEIFKNKFKEYIENQF